MRKSCTLYQEILEGRGSIRFIKDSVEIYESVILLFQGCQLSNVMSYMEARKEKSTHHGETTSTKEL